MPSLRIVFFGTAGIAVPSLVGLAGQEGLSIVAVVTQPDRPKGRALQLQPSAVKEAALRIGLPVLQPERCRNESFLSALRELKPDLIAVIAYGQILPPALLAIPAHGCLNVHASILPRHRGAAPIQWAVLEGDAETGVTIMKMDAGLDTGDMLSVERTPIAVTDTAQTVHDRLALLGAETLARTIPPYIAGELRPIPQPAEGVTYARKITREDGALDWRQPAVRLDRWVRGLTPWPGTFTHMPASPHPMLLKVWKAEVDPQGQGPAGTVLSAGREGVVVACGTGGLRLLELQREGGKRLAARDFLAGYPLMPGTMFV